MTSPFVNVNRTPTPSQSPADTLLKRLWRHGNYGYLWSNDPKETVWLKTDEAHPVLTHVPQHWKNVYFGVNPAAWSKSVGERAKREDVQLANVLYAEFDLKDYENEEALLSHLREIDPWPSWSVSSGGGYHLYWFLADPYVIENEADLRDLEQLQKAWVQYVGGDKAVHDIARVLRVPGTYNYKPKYAPDYPAVKPTLMSFQEYKADNLRTRAEPFMTETVQIQGVSLDTNGKDPVTLRRTDTVGLTEGGRQDTLFRDLSKWRALGASARQLTLIGAYLNSTYDPPMDAAELEHTIKNALSQESDEKKLSPVGAEWLTIIRALGYRQLAINVMDDSLYVNGTRSSDILENTIRTDLRAFGTHNVEQAIQAMYSDHTPKFHPLREYFEGLEWDGQDHIARLSEYFEDRRGHFEIFFRRWAVGAVERVYRGKHHPVLVMDGGQGLGKSYFCQWLGKAPGAEYFVDSLINPGDKDHSLRLISKFVWEIGELGSTFRRADIDALKQFLSQESVTERKPYGKVDLVKPAVTSFIATVNNDGGIFSDATGNRRFTVVTMKKIDWRYKDDLSPNQVWAQAYALYKSGETGDLAPEEMQAQNEVNEIYEVIDPLDDVIEEILRFDDPDAFTPAADIIERLQLRVSGTKSMVASKKVAALLARREPPIEKTVKRINGSPTRGYVGVKLSQTFALNAHLEAKDD